MSGNYHPWPYEELLADNSIILDVSSWPESRTEVQIIPDEEVAPLADPSPSSPVSPARISLEYESSGEESDLYELVNGPSRPSSPMSIPPSTSARVAKHYSDGPDESENLFQETLRAENLHFSSVCKGSLRHGQEVLSSYLQTG